MRELERLLGRKTMEVEILKEALDVARVKKPSLQLHHGRSEGGDEGASGAVRPDRGERGVRGYEAGKSMGMGGERQLGYRVSGV